MSVEGQSREEPLTGDPLIDEVRALRRDLWERAGGDLDSLFRYLRQQQQDHPGRIVDLRAESVSEDRPDAYHTERRPPDTD